MALPFLATAALSLAPKLLGGGGKQQQQQQPNQLLQALLSIAKQQPQTNQLAQLLGQGNGFDEETRQNQLMSLFSTLYDGGITEGAPNALLKNGGFGSRALGGF